MNPSRPSSPTTSGAHSAPLMVGDCPAMERLREQVQVAARYDEPVLILGETGVGKELVARSIHALGPRADRPFQVINCAAMTSEILASELFGHRAGAYTGAVRDRRGRLRAAAGSTVLLDELTETDAGFQAAILRAIETGEVQPLGDDRIDHVDVRFLATSNRRAPELGDAACLRPDLLYRIAAFIIDVPPLRDRLEGLPALCDHFLGRLRDRYGEARALSPGVQDLLRQHDYPGNVRELERILTRAYALALDEIITPTQLDAAIRAWPGSSRPPPRDTAWLEPGAGTDLALQSVIRAHIRHTIAIADRNLSEAARVFEIPRSTLQHYLSKYRINPAEERPEERSGARG